MRERQKVLEEMGVDVQRGGIGIDASKCYLMNMTFDPASKLLLLYNINVRVCALWFQLHAAMVCCAGRAEGG